MVPTESGDAHGKPELASQASRSRVTVRAVTSGSGPYEDYVTAATKLTRGQLLDLLLDVEDRLRKLIRAVFAQKRPDWERLIPQAIRDELQSTKSGPPDGWPSAGPQDLLSSATLKQLIDTLLARWALFEPLLHDKSILSARLEEFRIWRNQLAHGAQPMKDERVKIAFVAWEVAHQIPIPAPPDIASSPAPVAGGFALFGRRILWVDDIPENNRLERRWLQDLGADVVPVLSNDEAVMEASCSGWPTSPRSPTASMTPRGLPEVIMYGLRPETMQFFINEVCGRMLYEDVQYRHGEVITELSEEGQRLMVLDVEDLSPFGTARHLYGDIRAMQLVYADQEGGFPWEEGHSFPLDEQPLLGRTG
jgi:Domain of unknown function (DUF4262)